MLTAMSAALIAAGCGSSGDDTTSTTSTGVSTSAGMSPTASGGITVGYSDPVASNPAQQAVARGQEEAAKEFGWDLVHLDANLSASKQVSDIDTLISKKVDAINSFTIDQGAADAVYQRASQAGIPVIGQSSRSKYIQSSVWNQQNFDCSVAAKAAAYINARTPGAKTLVIGGPPVGAITQYVNCFQDEAEKAGLDVLEKKDNTTDTASGGQPIAAALINKHPDVQAIWCYNDPSCLGAGNALKAAGKKIWKQGESDSGVIVIGSNGSTDGISAIKSGLMTVSYDINPDKVGASVIALLAKHFEDGVPVKDLPKDVVVPTTEWDASNVGDYVDPIKRSIDTKTVDVDGQG